MQDPNHIPNGRAAAALIAGAAGIALLGIFSILAEGFPLFRNLMALYAAVGALSGKTIIPVFLWVFLWLGLDYSWKEKELDFTKVLVCIRILLVIGLLGTFPLVYRLFNAG